MSSACVHYYRKGGATWCLLAFRRGESKTALQVKETCTLKAYLHLHSLRRKKVLCQSARSVAQDMSSVVLRRAFCLSTAATLCLPPIARLPPLLAPEPAYAAVELSDEQALIVEAWAVGNVALWTRISMGRTGRQSSLNI